MNDKLVDIVVLERALNFMPIPYFPFYTVFPKKIEILADAFRQKGKLLAVSDKLIVRNQVICGLVIDAVEGDRLVLRGAHRAIVHRVKGRLAGQEEFYEVKAELCDYVGDCYTAIDERITEEYVDPIRELCDEINGKIAAFGDDILYSDRFDTLDAFIDFTAASFLSTLNLHDDFALQESLFSFEDQKKFLEELDPVRRARHLGRILREALDQFEKAENVSTVRPKTEETRNTNVPVRVNNNGGSDMNDKQRSLFEQWMRKFENAGVPETAMPEVRDELNKFVRFTTESSEREKTETYLRWILAIPWNKSTTDNLDIDHVQSVLNEDHYGLDMVTRRILEFIAVRKLKPDAKGPILCFIGPPGTGKTSICRSIARAIGRVYIRMALGGLNDEAEVKGHRRTYIGSGPGKVMTNIRKSGVNNPLFVLDEIDKVGKDSVRGDPESALLEVLDPEQNFSFEDRYLSTPFDLTNVMFIATGNDKRKILPALRDRMEFIEFPVYLTEDKLQIAKRHLIPEQIDQSGLNIRQIRITDDAIKHIILAHTSEAGVRQLKREIAKICRKIAVKVARGLEKRSMISLKNIHRFLGVDKFSHDRLDEDLKPGMAVGLAWTSVGGVILVVETCKTPGSAVISTGNLGRIIKESITAARTLIMNKADLLKLDKQEIWKQGFHIHIPNGATPVDGPSAGFTITVALASLLTGKPVKKGLALTGEITLRGAVNAIGGVRDKILAGKRAGRTEFIIPLKNRPNVLAIPEKYREGLTFHYVQNIDEVLKIALELNDE